MKSWIFCVDSLNYSSWSIAVNKRDAIVVLHRLRFRPGLIQMSKVIMLLIPTRRNDYISEYTQKTFVRHH